MDRPASTSRGRAPATSPRRREAGPVTTTETTDRTHGTIEARAPGLLLGIGLGAFVDGIVLHQVLQ